MKDKGLRKRFGPFPLFACLLVFFLPLFSEAKLPPISAKSAIIISVKDWQPLYDKSADLKLPMASTTKVMTALLAVEYLQGNEDVLISESAASAPPVKLGLRERGRYQADDLLYGLLLYSANDAGVALAEKIAGSEERFVEIMNRKARELGAKNTRFNNATGLPGRGQFTTVSDLALILSNALKNEKIVRIMQTKYTSIDHNGRSLPLKNKNKLLWQCPWTIGGKTGFTRTAGYCYVGEFKNEENEFIVVLLGSRRLWADASALVNYGIRLLTSPDAKDSEPPAEIKKTVKKSSPKARRSLKTTRHPRKKYIGQRA